MANFLPEMVNIEALWEKQAEKLPWFKKWSKVLEWNEPFAHWFVDGQINASYACLDAHLKNPDFSDKTAILWECEAGIEQKISYKELFEQVNNFAFFLKENGVKSGDVVMIYLPMIPQAIAATLAVARIGAIHSLVFSGFSAAALADRINDTQAKFLITCDFAIYRNKKIALKVAADQAVSASASIQRVFVINRQAPDFGLQCNDCDIVYNFDDSLPQVFVEPEPVESNHPLFILYTSGTTGKPKGVIHSTGGYLTYVYSTIKWAFDISKDSIYWCTADIGWITGHSYVIYGPLLHGATIFMREGAPDVPNAGAWWSAIQKHKISIFYTSPTALRMFMKLGAQVFENIDLSSLKILGSVGEPINPEVWMWFNERVGQGMCPIIDTWWQTETGGFMIAPSAGLDLVRLKPGSATHPLPGVCAEIVDFNNTHVSCGTKGYLVITKPWPGMTIGIHQNPDLFVQNYWSKFKGAYYSGDYAIKDKDGYFWLLGRADEVLNVSGHRIGTSEIESATLQHRAVAESAAIGVKDEVKGESIVVFTSLKAEFKPSAELKLELIQSIRSQIGAFATPKDIYFVENLPKTRSGKIMRRILKAIVQGEQLGDVSTLEDESSVEDIKLIYRNVIQSMQQ